MEARPLGRVMALDYGEKRIGIALSDPLRIIAQPWGMFPNTAAGLHAILELARNESVSAIVVGLPLTLAGKEGKSSQNVRTFIQGLESGTEADVIPWDERFTTTMAQQTLREIEPKRKNRSAKTGRLDAMAASVLLQSFLDSTKNSRVC